MYLTKTKDSIWVRCDSTQTVDLYGAWKHFDRQTFIPGGAGSITATSSATDPVKVVDAPAHDQISDIRSLIAHAAISNTTPVTVRYQVYDSATQVYRDLFSAPLNPGDSIQHSEDRGFYVTPASGLPATTADLVQQFIDALTNQSPNLPS